MPKICKIVAHNRKSSLVQFVARKCIRFLECYENADNYDFATNGEQFVLETLAGMDIGNIFDVGANVGEWSLLAHQFCPKASIECFEVLPATAEKLENAVSGVSQIRVNRLGLSNETGTVSLKTFKELSVLTSLVEVEHEFESERAIGEVIRGDEFVEREAISHIDFLKIDVEAAEFMVLQGFSNMMTQRQIDVIQFEYGTGSIVTKFMLKDYYQMLEPLGYRLGKIYPNYVEFRDYDENYEDFIGPNILAVRSDRPDIISALS